MKKPSLMERAMGATQAPAPMPALSPAGPHTPPNPLVGRAKTGPGAFVAHLAKESEVLRENQHLLDELKQWDGASATRHLDPTHVVPSEYANREESSFHSSEFKAFADEIESAGGNVQPIKVRPIAGSSPQKYEIVFGHRRHRACLERGVQLLAMIESIDDRALFQEMDRENRQRADLRPYEQGEMYRKALDKGLYPSLRAMAEALGVNAGNASVSIKIAKLDPVVLDAFPSRLDIQFRWGPALDEALSKDPSRVKSEAEAIKSERKAGAHISPGQVLARLTERPSAHAESFDKEILAGDRKLGFLRVRRGRISIELNAKAFSQESLEQVLSAIREASE